MDKSVIKKKIALVVHRYGVEVNGGAELHCRLLAHKLKDIYDVEVLTSCAIDDGSWANYYPEGNQYIEGIKVRRFCVEHKRDWEQFDNIYNLVKGNGTYEDEIKWIQAMGPYSLRLFEYIHQKYDKYDAIIFFTYLYYSTAICILGIPNAIILPTAHDENAIYLKHYKAVFENVQGIIYNTVEEKLLVDRLFNVKGIPYEICGVGIDEICVEFLPNVQAKYNLDTDYIVYAGRICKGKGCDILINYFLKYKAHHKNNLKLVMIGKKDMDIPENPDIILTGFVSDEDKNALIYNAKYMVLASHFESLSIVLLEAMYLRVPVLVTSKCEVLKGHVERSSAGLTFKNYSEFDKALELIGSDSNLLEEMGCNGRKYVDENYNWKVIVTKISNLINMMTFVKAENNEIFELKTNRLKPYFDSNYISIVFASDNNFVPYLAIAIQSVLETLDDRRNYDIIVLADGIDSDKIHVIERMGLEYERVKIRFVDISSRLDQYVLQIHNKQLSRATFMRLFMPEIMADYDKALYLDCDIIVKQNLTEIYDVELGDNLVAAVKDPHIDVIRRYRKEVEQHLEEDVLILRDSKYFNAGILLFNLGAFREKFSTEYLFRIAESKEWMWEDQDVLNFICKDHVYWLNSKWNFIWMLDEAIQNLINIDRDYLVAKENPGILHYAGGVLPTKEQFGLFSEDFWTCARKTPYYEILVSDRRVKKESEIKRGFWAQKFYNMKINLHENGLCFTIKLLFMNLWWLIRGNKK